MTWTEMKFDTSAVCRAVIRKFGETYPTAPGLEGVFVSPSGVPFSVHMMGQKEPWNFLVVEYHDTGEDGDGFYPEDYESFESLLSDMIAEVIGP